MKRFPDPSGNLILDEGDYGQKDGIWYVRPPGQRIGAIAHHVITEHEDGTITVIPSIQIWDANGEELWYGCLAKGEFIEYGKTEDTR